MLEIFNFLKNNWELVAAVITLIISVIVSVLRKRPVNDIMSNIYDYCIYFINRFEEPGNGVHKKEKVVRFVKESLLNVFPKLDIGKYDSLINKTIEKILTTPQKKGE